MIDVFMLLLTGFWGMSAVLLAITYRGDNKFLIVTSALICTMHFMHMFLEH